MDGSEADSGLTALQGLVVSVAPGAGQLLGAAGDDHGALAAGAVVLLALQGEGAQAGNVEGQDAAGQESKSQGMDVRGP